MKKSLIVIVCMLVALVDGFSQGSYTSTNNHTGYWTDPIWTPEFGWMATQPSATDVGGSYTMNVYGYVTVNGDLSVSGGGLMNVYDTLVITGNLNITSSSGINVQPGGVLIILGNFTSTGGGNKINVIGSGRAAIVGDYQQQQGSVTTGSAYYIYDTTPNFTTGGCNGGASVDGTAYTCPPANTAVLASKLDTETDLFNKDKPLYDFIGGLGVACSFSNVGAASNAQFICSGVTPAALTANAVSGTVTYLWESSTTSATTGFGNAAGTRVNQNYSPAALTQTTWFRRKVTRSSCTNALLVIKITVMGSGGWTGVSSSAWNTASNWCGGVPTATIDAIIPVTTSGRYPSVSSAANCRDLQIELGASVAVSSSSLTIYGNLTNNGAFTPSTSGTNTVVFKGAGQQTVTGGPYNFYILQINNTGTAAVVFQNDVMVSNALTLTSGKVNLSGKKLTLGTSSSSLGLLTSPVGTGSGIMNGTLERWVPSGSAIADNDYKGFFPMVTANNSRPFYISYPSPAGRPSTAGTVLVSHTEANTVTTSLNITDGASTIKRRQNSFWSVSTANSLAGGIFNLKAGGSGFGTIGAITDLHIMRISSVTGTHGTNNGTPSDFLAQRTAVSTLANNYYIGSINDTQTPLPIEMLSFTGETTADGTLLKWVTSMEKNFDHFEIERSTDGVHYTYVDGVAGKGAIKARTDYSYMDDAAPARRVYYRLKNVDLDETFDYSDVVTVVVAGKTGGLAVYPNPVVDNRITVNLPESGSPSYLVLLDQVGNQVLKADLVAGEQEIVFDETIHSGIYFARIFRAGSPVTTVKLKIQ